MGVDLLIIYDNAEGDATLPSDGNSKHKYLIPTIMITKKAGEEILLLTKPS
jgi:hypothetical protein